jgi:hypothetical protein
MIRRTIITKAQLRAYLPTVEEFETQMRHLMLVPPPINHHHWWDKS